MNTEPTADQILESPYVLGTRKQDNFKIIDIQFPAEWEFPDRLFPQNGGISISQGTAPDIFSFFSETKSFSDVYKVLSDVIRYNKEKEEKLLLLNKLQAELQRWFEELPLADFKQLRIARAQAAPTGQPTPPVVPAKVQPQPVVSEQKKIITPTPQNDGTVLRP